jgi:hypothetical protein
MEKWIDLERKKHSCTYQFNGVLTDEELVYCIEENPKLLPRHFIYNICLPDNLSNEKFL